jgi:hypothetical protein
MKVQAKVLRAMLAAVRVEETRYAINGFRVEPDLVEVTDTRMLLAAPLEAEPDIKKPRKGVTFQKPFALPPATPSPARDSHGCELKPRTLSIVTGERACITNGKGQSAGLVPLDGAWPDTSKAWAAGEGKPKATVAFRPDLLRKVAAFFEAAVGGNYHEGAPVVMEIREANGAVMFHQPGTGLKAALMPVRMPAKS